MPKTAGKGKSSATPATRKKNERAALKKQGIDPDTVGKGKGSKGGSQQQRGQKKKKNQKKMFVPPPKPPPPPPDPLDDMGLASLLPAGLVVLLRRASKKDVITRTRACEALLSWVRGSDEEGITASDDERREAEVTWLPCWAHLFPRLSISPTRRLRSLAASIHAVLLTQGHTRAEMLNTPAYVESTLGPLVVLAHDTDRGVARGAKTALEGFVQWTMATADQRLDAREQLYTLLPHLRLLLLSPSPAAALRETAPAANSNNASGAGTPVPHAPVRFDSGLARDAKARDDANVEEDIRATDGRLAAGAAGALAWVVSSHPAPLPMEQFEELLTSAEMWSLLTPPDIVKLESPAPPAPAPEAVKAKRNKKRPPSPPPPPPLPPIGSETPLARARAWSLVSSLVNSGTPALLDAALPVFAPLAMPAFWAERDATCARAAIDALLPLLKLKPETWELAGVEEGADEAAAGGTAYESQSLEKPKNDDRNRSDLERSVAPPARSTPVPGEVEAASDSDSDAEDEVSAASDSEEEEDDSDDGDEDDEDDEAKGRPVATISAVAGELRGLLRWLSSACAGLPSLAYPAVVVLISGIPAKLLPPTFQASEALLQVHWSGLTSRAGADPQALRAFVASYCECAAFLAGRMFRAGDDTARSQAADFADWSLARPWNAFVMGDEGETLASDPANVPLRARAALEPAQPFSGAVRRLAAFSEDLYLVKAILARSRASLHALAKQGTSSLALSRAVRTLAAIGASGAPNGLDNAVRELVLDSTGTAANVLCASTEEASIAPLVSLIGSLLHTFPEAHVNAEEGIANALASAARNVLPQALRDAHVPGAAAANFYASYLPLVQDANERGEVWTNALESISSPAGLDAEALEALFSAAETLSASLLSEENVTSARLDEQVLTLGTAVFNGTEQPSGSERAVLSRLLDRPLPFVTQATSNALLGLLVQALGSQSTNEESKRHASTLLALLEAWCTTRERLQKLVSDPTLRPASAAVFCLAHLEPSPEYGTAATRLWNALAAEPTAGVAAVALLRERILQPETSLRALLRAGEALPPTADGSSLLLSEAELASFFTEACASRPRSELAVLDPLVPYGKADDINSKAATEGKQEYDAAGLSTYARAVAVMIQVLSKAGKGARATPWALPHLILFAIAAEDATSLHAASPFFFAPGAHTQALAKYATDAVNVATAMISGLAGDLDDHWHLGTTDALRKPSAAPEGLAAALHSLWYRNESQAARVLSRLLAGILSFSAATEAAGTAWLRLAQGATDSKLSSAAAVLKVVKPLVLSSPVYERVRNELAARLAGIPPTRVEKEGLPLLRLLLAAAPPEDAPVALVPQQRAIFLLQAVQKWYASEEAELGDESFVRLSQIFSELLPIVDNMPGSHLELILDVLEAQLEAGGWTADGLPTTQAALRLLEQVQQRAARAQALREVWNARQADVLSMLRPLFLDQPLESGINVPLSETTALLARLVRRLPDSAFKQEGDETRLTTLLQAPDRRVQLTAYRRLATFVRSRVSDLVVEAAVDPTHAGKAAALSAQLTQQCSSAPGAGLPIADIGRYAEEAVEEPQTTLAFFLSWLALFEHFEEASLALKSAFAAQIEQMELLSTGFLPTTFGLMLRKGSTGRPWDPRGWALDEVFLDDVDPYAPGTLQLLAGHLFHRALGHLAVGVRNYVMSMRDRALSSSITSLTTRHFSPVLAGAELAHLRSGDARSTLEGEGLSIKITTANEVVATYTVDEQDMQIGVSFPNDFPLHGVEVRDIKRVGVSEARWRSWLLATQQLLTGKNGLVFDALLLFKRNAEAMFAGYEGSECAICYSIIGGESGSLMLPTKKCATCKKPFHSSCLLRWSLTSGSSTCPMCRSIL
ncbi:hypothetical protein IE81DRAFT_345709 [Ceraceosorus guamensis]|uniref:E3 ubiquitin-protein ligase listerin n=1 Tax=Ceraceosorus guamensis TaxID=1522189 RepID=A0A316W463_9BASI|nr:hypothetical protein IE81DRAFT_345709 [Ceraceosorus guamensis]PWN44482.1 hypothetical protein IE81DRAFT_345709 [Ceraceosorus guamensis]